MKKVKIKTSDGQIWQSQQVLQELVIASQSDDLVVLDLEFEGPCCQSSGINDLLKSIIKNFGFDPKKYLIETSNQISTSDFTEVRKSFVELDYVKAKARSLSNTPSTLSKRFGLFVGRSNWLRLAIGSYLYTRYRDQTVLTYHFDFASDYHRANFGLEDLLSRHHEDIDAVITFVKRLPIKTKEHQYPILWSQTAMDLEDMYKDIFCDMICETYYSGSTFMMTEKTMRSISHRRPFLVQGPQWYLKNLQKLGFKTFDSWWDEGYDEDPWDFKYTALKHNIDYIAKQDHATISRWYQEMQPTLDHNYFILQSLTDQQILDTKFHV